MCSLFSNRAHKSRSFSHKEYHYYVTGRTSQCRGCELILRKYPHLINVCKPDGFGPLHLASINGDYSLVKFLLEQVSLHNFFLQKKVLFCLNNNSS